MLHQFFCTTRIIVKSNVRMRCTLLRNISRDLDTGEGLLPRLIRVTFERARRGQIFEIMVIGRAVITSADNRGQDFRISVSCKDVAAGSRRPRRPAAIAVAPGGEDVRQEFGEEDACAGETGADNCYVALDGGPGCCADVVICRLLDLACV
jgi:hypothetical protein